MTFFDLKQGQDLENWAAHLHQDFQGVTQPPPPHQGLNLTTLRYVLLVLLWM